MKKTAFTTVVISTMLFIFSTVSYAQGHSSSWYGGMAYSYRAEKEIRANEQKGTADKDNTIADTISVAEVENRHMSTSEKTDADEKKNEEKK
jgi:hypothetical protein